MVMVTSTWKSCVIFSQEMAVAPWSRICYQMGRRWMRPKLMGKVDENYGKTDSWEIQGLTSCRHEQKFSLMNLGMIRLGGKGVLVEGELFFWKRNLNLMVMPWISIIWVLTSLSSWVYLEARVYHVSQTPIFWTWWTCLAGNQRMPTGCIRLRQQKPCQQHWMNMSRSSKSSGATYFPSDSLESRAIQNSSWKNQHF